MHLHWRLPRPSSIWNRLKPVSMLLNKGVHRQRHMSHFGQLGKICVAVSLNCITCLLSVFCWSIRSQDAVCHAGLWRDQISIYSLQIPRVCSVVILRSSCLAMHALQGAQLGGGNLQISFSTPKDNMGDKDAHQGTPWPANVHACHVLLCASLLPIYIL